MEAEFVPVIASDELGRLLTRAADEGAERLDLSWGNLPELPGEIGLVRSLRSLDLTGNRLRRLPEALCELPALEELRLSVNELRDLPEGLGRLHLRLLDVSYNALEAAPKVVGRLQELEQLDLSHNLLRVVSGRTLPAEPLKRLRLESSGLSALPTDLERLKHLAELDVGNGSTFNPREVGKRLFPKRAAPVEEPRLDRAYDNVLHELDPSIGGLAELRQLRLFGIRLQRLPAELGALGKLQVLEASENELRELPVEVTWLSALDRLAVNSNQLNALPPGFGELQELADLELRGNGLTELPDDLGELFALQFLQVSENRLATIQPIEGLTRLVELDAHKNEIVSVPPGLGRFKDLDLLDLSDNRIARLPKELGDLPAAVDLRLDGNPLEDPLPTLLHAGMSDVLTYLRSLGDDERRFEAKVLLVGEGNVGKTSLIAALLGEGFEPNRSSTHGIELRPLELEHPTELSNLMLNVWDFGGQDVYRITHQFFFSRRAIFVVVWNPREGREQNEIEAWCRRIRLRVGGDARILVVATHCDDRRPELDYTVLERRFGALLVGNHAVDNRTGTGIEHLRRDLARHAAALADRGEVLPASWRAVRDDLERLREPQISRTHFERLSAQHGLGEDEAVALIAFLHEIGVVIHYADDAGLQDIIVLQPEWLTKAISDVLEDAVTADTGGVLAHSRLPEIWTGDRAKLRYHPYFLRLMEKFDVSFRIPDSEASLVAQLVPYGQPPLPWRDSSPRVLELVCRLREPAEGLIAWLTVRHHRFSVGCHWRRGVFLEHQRYRAQALLELAPDDDRRLDLTVRGPSPDFFFTILRDSVEHLVAERWPGLDIELLVPCGGESQPGVACPEYFKFRWLERAREEGERDIRCHGCGTRQDIGRLLTGFRSPTGSTTVELNRMLEQLTAILKRIDDVAVAQAKIDEWLLLLYRLTTAEATDCPRLFHLVPVDPRGLRRARFWDQRFRLSLWCEHPGEEHPCPGASYEISIPAEGFAQLLPYARLVIQTLRIVVPVAGAFAGVAVPTVRDELGAELDLMEALLDAAPDGESSGLTAFTPQRGLSRAEGPGLRALRSLLFRHDTHDFGGLTPRPNGAGDFLWICREHDVVYDPGLPRLAAVEAQYGAARVIT